MKTKKLTKKCYRKVRKILSIVLNANNKMSSNEIQFWNSRNRWQKSGTQNIEISKNFRNLHTKADLSTDCTIKEV